MKDTGGILPLNSQKPFVRLLVSLMVFLLVSLILVSLTMLMGKLIFGTVIGDLNTGQITIDEKQRAYVKFIQAFQHISLFLAPSLIVAYIMTGNIAAYLKADHLPAWTQILFVFILALLLIPLISDLGIWNSKLSFPPWLSGLENWMMWKEEDAKILTGWLIYSESSGGLIVNIIIIALLPALGEEFLFRGVLQDIFSGLFRSEHGAILFTALLFSIFHLQFYGLVPRMVLGIVYGYLFLWSRSIWLPVLAHFINNLVPVILAHRLGWEAMNTDIRDYVQGEGYSFFIPLALCCLVMFVIRDLAKSPSSG